TIRQWALISSTRYLRHFLLLSFSTTTALTIATPNSITSIPVTPATTTFQAPVRTVLGARYLLKDLPESIRILLREDDDQTHQPSLQQKHQQQHQQQHQHQQHHQQPHQHQQQYHQHQHQHHQH